jgi:MFS family permease
MPAITIGFGAVLCAIGLWGYFGAEPDKQSMTAFIPAFFGIGLIVCGLLAMKWRAHAMHAAAAIGLVGFIAAAGRGLPKLGSAISDDPTIHRAPRLVLLMALVCLVFVATCVWSFIQARRRRKASEAA